jgi:transcriptional regulator with XRE-family HTH domain
VFAASRINRHVGARIQLRRIRLGMSRKQLAGVVGVRAAEMELYEEGVAKVPAGLLVNLVEALSVPISYFFLDLSRSDR